MLAVKFATVLKQGVISVAVLFCAFNSLPNDKFFDWFKLKAYADDNKWASKIEICFGKGRKHCGKGENACYQHFLLFPQCFPKPSFSESFQVGIVW